MSRAILAAYIEQQRKMNALRRERRLRRAISAPMALPEQEFIAHFRLRPDSYKQLVEAEALHASSTSKDCCAPRT